MSRKSFWILLIIMGLGIIGCNSAVKTDIIAEVNGEKISQTQWDERYQVLKSNYEANKSAGSDNEITIDETKDKELVKQLRNNAFDNLVFQALLKQDAKKRGIAVSDDELKGAVAKMKANKLGNGQDQFSQYMKANGLSEKQLSDELKTKMLINKVQASVIKKVEVSEAEVQKYYQDNQASFKETGGTQISHILVASEKQAREILKQLEQGQDFAELAREYSTCPSKEQGGDLGPVNPESNYVPQFKAAALKLQPGEITTEPVKTEFGYHIIKAGERKADQVKSFEEVKDQIKMNLENQKMENSFNSYLEELKKKAEIKDYRQ